MARTFNVAVVGCGVGGATVALLLARAGHSVDVFERAATLGPVGAGILLQPSGQQILARLGLLEQVAAQGEPIHELHATWPGGGTLIRIRWADAAPGYHALGLHRADLFGVLHGAALRAGVRVHTSAEVREVSNGRDGALLTDSRGEPHGPYDFVIAADGARSLLRGACRLREWVHEYDYGAAWAIGHSDAVRGRLDQVVDGTHRLLGLLPMGGGRCSLFWGVRRDQHDALRHNGFAAWRAEVAGMSPLGSDLLAGVGGFDHVVFTTYHHVWMPATYEGRTVYLGDAAHATSPHLGQGVNLALADAWSFARALRHTRDFRSACVHHREARRAHVRYYGIVTAALTPFFQSRGRVMGMGRDLVLPVMTRVPWLRRQMALTMAGVKGGFLRSNWSVED